MKLSCSMRTGCHVALDKHSIATLMISKASCGEGNGFESQAWCSSAQSDIFYDADGRGMNQAGFC